MLETEYKSDKEKLVEIIRGKTDTECTRLLVEMTRLKLQQPDVKSVKVTKDIGRNDKCPCGSGRKFKKCCMLK